MKVAVVGSGAIGLYYGAMLQQAGCSVHFLVRTGVETLQREGLHLHLEGKAQAALPVAAYGSSEEIGPVDLVLVALKSTANAVADAWIRPLLGEHTQIITLQNGLGNVEWLSRLASPERVGAGLCFICLNRVSPSRVNRMIAGSIALGSFGDAMEDTLDFLVEAFNRVGVQAKRVHDLGEQLWRKLCWNVPFNGLAVARGGINTEQILASREHSAMVRTLLGEVQQAAASMAYTIEDRFLERQIELTQKMGPYRPSSLIDFLQGRPVEVEAIWGEPLRQAQAAGAVLPAWQDLYERLRQVTV